MIGKNVTSSIKYFNPISSILPRVSAVINRETNMIIPIIPPDLNEDCSGYFRANIIIDKSAITINKTMWYKSFVVNNPKTKNIEQIILQFPTSGV